MRGFSDALLIAVSFFLTAPLASAIAQIDPDAGEEAGVAPDRAVAAVLDPDCDIIGDYIDTFHGAGRYRGNVYHFDFQATLKEIQMELTFSGTTDLHVAIHRKEANGTYVRYLGLPDVVISQAVGLGAGVSHFYSTADANPPMVVLEAGFDYAIAFAWGPKDITFGRDRQSYPVPFRAGQVLGLVGAFTLPPDPNHTDPDPLIPDTFPESVLRPYEAAAYSMQLCFVFGACCNAAVCSREIRSICERDGGEYRGDNTTCDGPNPCPCTLDNDCDDGNVCTPNDRCENGLCVNDWRKGPTEFIQFADCLAGPDQPIQPDCICFDLNADDHVDLRDVAQFFLTFESP